MVTACSSSNSCTPGGLSRVTSMQFPNPWDTLRAKQTRGNSGTASPRAGGPRPSVISSEGVLYSLNTLVKFFFLRASTAPHERVVAGPIARAITPRMKRETRRARYTTGTMYIVWRNSKWTRRNLGAEDRSLYTARAIARAYTITDIT